MGMTDDVTVLREAETVYDDGTVVSIRLLSVPVSETFPMGIKYKYHYGEAGATNPIIRFDNHHGPHELHLDDETFEIEFPGFTLLTECFRTALPSEKRRDW